MVKKTTKKTVTLTFGAAQMKALKKEAAEVGLSVETMLEMQICMASASREVLARYARIRSRRPILSAKTFNDIRLSTVFGPRVFQDQVGEMAPMMGPEKEQKVRRAKQRKGLSVINGK